MCGRITTKVQKHHSSPDSDDCQSKPSEFVSKFVPRRRSASPSRCGRFFAAATARTAGDRSPTLGLQRIATFLNLVQLRLVASRTALRRGAVRMWGHRRWSRQREKSVRDELLGGYLKQIYPVTCKVMECLQTASASPSFAILPTFHRQCKVIDRLQPASV
ncbi:Wax ester synthase/acyl-coadiacylglycerolacyltransferase [Striga asiatica]|uniref:Wax ester synthase/acyl-coadiacylglycerolacyltransferase n=1 Tax=Striga asiatica TaxID=4170 RepID=A0A5A7PYU8_STRAF|nr:Wax ester synthase/acyl-coadiacylglycerolacyltransferase [Striga asiatica]